MAASFFLSLPYSSWHKNGRKYAAAANEERKRKTPPTDRLEKKSEVKFFNRDLLSHFMSTEAAAQ